jgi:Mlc titration factor MtfA (ptsG expression regulator)
VASETFFTDPHALRAEFPGVYEQLALFYRQDPAARLLPRA